MAQSDDRLTLEALLADPLTRLVMRSDNVTVGETAKAFAAASAGLPRHQPPARGARQIMWRRSGLPLCPRC